MLTEIHALNESHLADALALSAEAHCNQTIDDWRTMLGAGKAIGITASDGRFVASALTLPHGDTFGWISMVLVTESWRKKGLATQLLERAIEMLEADGLTPVLDATPAGENVYRPLGFVPHFAIQRWEIDAAASAPVNVERPPCSRALKAGDREAILAYDQGVFGGDRGAILDALISRSAGLARIEHAGLGYLLSRDGRLARQIGPLCADDEKTAIDMLERALAGMSGPVFIDACDHHPGIVERLKTLGFKSQRPFWRMAKNRNEPFGEPARVFALAGPELG